MLQSIKCKNAIYLCRVIVSHYAIITPFEDAEKNRFLGGRIVYTLYSVAINYKIPNSHSCLSLCIRTGLCEHIDIPRSVLLIKRSDRKTHSFVGLRQSWNTVNNPLRTGIEHTQLCHQAHHTGGIVSCSCICELNTHIIIVSKTHFFQ